MVFKEIGSIFFRKLEKEQINVADLKTAITILKTQKRYSIPYSITVLEKRLKESMLRDVI